MIRFATVGTSGITEHFLSAARLVPQLRHTAVYSRSLSNARAFGEKHGAILYFDDLTKMAESPEIDAVYIASPNVFHAAQSRIFLENGKHVLCEKPITTSLEDYRKLCKSAKQNGVVYMEAIMTRHVLWHQEVLSALSKIGTPALARIDFCQRSSRYDSFLAGEPQNIFDPAMHAGTLSDLGIYCVWAAVDFFGKPKNIEATASFFDNGADRAGTAVFDYGGFQAVLAYSKAGQSALGSEIIGDKGSLKISSVSQYTDVILHCDGQDIPIAPAAPRAEVMRGEAQCFADKILNNHITPDALCDTVHWCMEEIKNKAGIVYPR